jgi:transposase
VKEWLAKNIQIHLIYLPPKSPRLNPIEDIWRWLNLNIDHFGNYVFEF